MYANHVCVYERERECKFAMCDIYMEYSCHTPSQMETWNIPVIGCVENSCHAHSSAQPLSRSADARRGGRDRHTRRHTDSGRPTSTRIGMPTCTHSTIMVDTTVDAGSIGGAVQPPGACDAARVLGAGVGAAMGCGGLANVSITAAWASCSIFAGRCVCVCVCVLGLMWAVCVFCEIGCT